MVDHVDQTSASHWMIINDEYPGLLNSGLGSSHLTLNLHATVVPLPMFESTLSMAPIISARYSMMRKPMPSLAPLARPNPWPWSFIANVSSPSDCFRLTIIDLA